MAISRVWTKPQTQEAIRALKDAGLTMVKDDGSYRFMTKKGECVFTALRGHNTYLVRYNEDLFQSA